jgi:pyruvate formate-lyase activating enzyme-like uncharacterized protein
MISELHEARVDEVRFSPILVEGYLGDGRKLSEFTFVMVTPTG